MTDELEASVRHSAVRGGVSGVRHNAANDHIDHPGLATAFLLDVSRGLEPAEGASLARGRGHNRPNEEANPAEDPKYAHEASVAPNPTSTPSWRLCSTTYRQVIRRRITQPTA